MLVQMEFGRRIILNAFLIEKKQTEQTLWPAILIPTITIRQALHLLGA